MSTTWLPCSVYHQNYAQDHAWFQTKFIKVKMKPFSAVTALSPLMSSVRIVTGLGAIT